MRQMKQSVDFVKFMAGQGGCDSHPSKEMCDDSCKDGIGNRTSDFELSASVLL